jgi:HNH endonuclease
MRAYHITPLPKGSSNADRVLAYSIPEPNSGCWLWMACLGTGGYGRLGKKFAHRVSYEIFKCEVPRELDLDHLCRVRCCVNPDHLEPVTRKVNVNRGQGMRNGADWQESKTHCPKGHVYSIGNTYTDPSGCRHCLICRRAAVNRWAAKTENKIRQKEYLREWRLRRKAKKEGVS